MKLTTPDGDGVLVGQRVADGAHPLADPQPRGVAQHGVRERARALDPDQRDVRIRIRSHQVGAQRAAVGQLHGETLGAFDHVVVREDVAFGVDQEAGARAAPRRVATPAEVERVDGPAPRAFLDEPSGRAARGPWHRCSPRRD